MPIDPNFPKNHKVIGKHKHADSEHFHFLWGPGRAVAEAAGTFNEDLAMRGSSPPHAH